MARRFAAISCGVMVMSFFLLGRVIAGDTAEGDREELRQLRETKAKLNMEYEDQMRRLHKESEDRMAGIKADYRKTREALIADMDSKMKQTRLSYESKLKPMLREEDRLIGSLGPSANQDFARTKLERAGN